ncbi:amidase [Actinomadura keratinilytica]
MRVAEYVHHDAVGLAQLVADGEVTVAELQTAALKAAQAVNPQINAVVETWLADDGPRPAGAPLAGVPFLIKDIGAAMAGRRMELGSRLAAGNVARADSALMLRVRRAGLVTFGRTATSEMAYSITTEPVLYGATRNPWDPERSAGGSSGGAGAAVAAGVVPLAHGTDAAGSLRVPAAYNGLFGLKPTRGRVSLGPDFDELFSGLAVAGSVSRTVRDSAALLDQISGPEPGDPYFARQPSRPYAEEVTRHPGRCASVSSPRHGVDAAPPHRWPTPSRTAGLLESLGHQVEEAEVGLGAGWEEYVLANARLFTANLAATVDELAAALGLARRFLHPRTGDPRRYHYGQRVGGAQFVAALAVRNRVSRSLARSFGTYDILLTPTVPELPVPLGAYTESARTLDGLGWIGAVFDRAPFTMPFNMAGTPAMSVPLTADAETGLPIGMQFAAGYGLESRLFRLAGQLEQASPWSGRIPAVWAGGRAGR